MGEIADMMIEGRMCETCGEIFDEEVGYPRKCQSCLDEDKPVRLLTGPRARVACEECGKLVAPIGMKQHYDAKHPE